MTSQHRPLIAAAVGLAATVTLVGCTAVQDTLQVGQREFTYADSTEAEESGESFRFQGFLPDDATDVRLIAQLDGRASVMRWTSPTIFTSEHCTNASITSQPEIEAEWLPDPVPTSGVVCSDWSIVRSGDTQVAWRNSPDD